jgi:Cu2+-exporting ATPase
MNMPYGNYIMWVLATPVLLVWGRSFYINAWHQLKIKKANMDSLVALSTGIAYIFSVFNTLNPQYWHSRGLHPHVYFEASVVIIFFILLGKWLEEKAKSNTSNAIKKLIGLQPKTVSLLQHDNTTIQVPIDQIKKEDVIVVKPGDKIPVDGVVVSGESFVDESSINGEPIPVLKNINTKVFTGTINQKGTMNISAQKVGDETLLAQIIKMVQEAQGSKAPIQKNVDKIASVFVPTVMMIALVTFIVWMVSGIENSFTYGLLSAITVLVIACPCALGLATPTAIMVGIGKGAQLGILIKDAEALELSKNINAIILDKTGTITEGKPKVESLVWNKQLSNINELTQILFSIESKSEHPLAQSVCDYLKQTDAMVIDGFENITGKGVKAHVNGVLYFVGSMSFMNDMKLSLSDDLQKEFNDYSEQAYTVFAFSNQQEVLALIAITDKIKETSIQAINGLQEMGIDVYMLTGDSEVVAKNVASKTGIKLYKSSVMPQDKAAFTKELQSKGKVVAMVGDGINDSNALAQADVSFAMAKGSDIAMDVAKVTIMSSDLMQLLKAIHLSRLTVSKIRQNLFWAFIYNVIGIPLAAGILFPVNGFLLNPMIAGGAMALSSVSVVTNSLLLKFKKI